MAKALRGAMGSDTPSRANRFWQSYFPDATVVEFGDFTESYARATGRTVSAAERRAMRRHLDFHNKGLVTLGSFRTFVNNCGPFEKCAVNCLNVKPEPPTPLEEDKMSTLPDGSEASFRSPSELSS